jgi:GntR family transcriptional regulator
MDVDRHADRALYLQLADVLRSDINEGRLQPGERLPSETELIDRHGVSRGTVREAIGVLRNEGAVVVEHGRGAFVRSSAQEALVRATTCQGPYLGARQHFEESARQKGRAPSVRQVADPGGDAVPSEIATRLGINGRVKSTTLLCFADGRPEQLSRLWRAPGSQDPMGTALVEEISARMPSREERRLLQLDDGTPVLTVNRQVLRDETLVEYSTSALAATRQRLVYTLDGN